MKRHSLRLTLVVWLGLASAINIHLLAPSAYAVCGTNGSVGPCKPADTPPQAPAGEGLTILETSLSGLLAATEHILGLR